VTEPDKQLVGMTTAELEAHVHEQAEELKRERALHEGVALGDEGTPPAGYATIAEALADLSDKYVVMSDGYLVLPDVPETKTAGGILTPYAPKDVVATRGTIVAKGPGFPRFKLREDREVQGADNPRPGGEGYHEMQIPDPIGRKIHYASMLGKPIDIGPPGKQTRYRVVFEREIMMWERRPSERKAVAS
jgi:hypothetical protein